MGIRSQNNPLAAYLDVFSNTGTDAVGAAPPGSSSGLTATGGIISDYTTGPGDVYRAHVFTSSGTFNVTALGSFGDTLEYLVVAGGGGGGYDAGGGGGAGAFRTNLTGHPLAQSAFPVSVSPYTVTIGGGGSGSASPAPNRGISGADSVFGSITSPGGGGGGGVSPPSHRTGSNGGSGGGGAMSFNGGKGAYPGSPNPSPFRMGYDGGNGTDNGGDNIASGGGGGAGGAGSNGAAPAGPGGAGGAGSPIAIETATAKLYAGGGGGGAKSGPGTGGPGGGGNGGHRPSVNGTPGTYATGGGGGGGATNPPAGGGGNGGSGIVVVRYQIASVATAKATGGAISFYGGKTIHAFTGSGTFDTTSDWSAATVEYVVIGGGGGGGVNEHGGGGGAGAYRTGTTPIGAHPVSTSIQVGGGGIQNKGLQNPLPAAHQGTPSYFGTPITSPGGGGGGVDDGQSPFPTTAPGEQGMPGGSGGGSALDKTDAGGPSTGASFPGTIGATPVNGWGHPGGVGSRSPIGGGGGGGAGGAGAAPPAGRVGGIGIQLPATFRDPVSAVGAPGPTSPSVTGADNSGKYYVAGGGAAQPAASGSAGGGGYYTPSPAKLIGAAQNTGSGGGVSPIPYFDSSGGSGGASGIVLIAYPS
ncbi:hypothetical protein N9991_00010 [bacterium]|nr:hypothetical protein [bacterium]